MARGNYPNKAAQSVAEFRVEPESLPRVPAKGKSGRPKKGEVHKISLAIPVELYEGVEFASYLRRDLERNLDKYREFKTMMEEMSSTM